MFWFIIGMRIQSDNISFKGYDARPLKGFLMTGNYGNLAKELQIIGDKHGFDIFVLQKSEIGKSIPNFSIYERNPDFWAQDLWTVVNESLLNLFSSKANRRTELFKQFFSLKDNPVQKGKRAELINWNASKIEEKLYSGIEDDVLLSHFSKYCDISEETHIAGGNIYLIKSSTGKNNLLVGKDEINKFSIKELKAMYNADKVCFVPQMDYHLDLFIRPLRDNVVLLGDENLTRKILAKLLCEMKKYRKPKELEAAGIIDLINKFKGNIKSNTEYESPDYEPAIKKIQNCICKNEVFNSCTSIKTDTVEKILTDSGYKVVRVPGIINNVELVKYWDKSNEGFVKCRILNYMNACVTVNKNNDIIYITNKDNLFNELNISEAQLKKFGINFEEEFKRSVEDYIKPENVYFLRGEGNALGESLTYRQGGIHCITTEIPQI